MLKRLCELDKRVSRAALKQPVQWITVATLAMIVVPLFVELAILGDSLDGVLPEALITGAWMALMWSVLVIVAKRKANRHS